MSAVLTIELSRHAVERFRERVRPGLDVDAASDELARLAAIGEIHEEAPEWLASRQRQVASLYLVAGDVVLPLQFRMGEDDCYGAMTCLVRGGLSLEARARRHARRRRRHPARARWTLAG